MGKNNRSGKAAIIHPEEWRLIDEQLNYSYQKLLINILRFTGERIGAAIQLKVSDCYHDPIQRIPLEIITFQAKTRKQSAGAKTATRQVLIAPQLRVQLGKYDPPLIGWLFPSPRDPIQHISHQAIDHWFKGALRRAGLSHRGITLHSPRRTALTRMSNAGIPLAAIKEFSGHKSLAALQPYIETDPLIIQKAINLL